MTIVAVKSAAKVCLVSSHALFLTQFQGLLSHHGFHPVVCGDTDIFVNGQARVSAMPHASVYVLDAHANPQLSVSVVSRILDARPNSHILAFGDKFEEQTAFPLLRAGVRGLLTYEEATGQLGRAVDAVAAGAYWVPRALLSRFVESILTQNGRRNSLPAMGASVSQREQQILKCLLRNLANKEIASELNISERTVKFHVSNLLSKFNVQRRADLIVLAYQNPARHPLH